jgi:hypothetical protein
MLLAAAMLIPAAACEDKGIGRPCSLGKDVATTEGAYSVEATDCQTRMCIKPALQPGVVPDGFDTGSYCSASCSSDSDCQGQTRDRSDPNDKRCKTGFVCAKPFGASEDTPGGGKLCCQKLCLCRDFFSAAVGPATPKTCEGAADSCSSVQRD